MLWRTNNFLSPKLLQSVIFILFILGLSVAYYAEIALGKEPCILCVYTRYAFMAGAVITILSLLISQIRVLVPLAIIGCLSLSAFHVGVEQKWWKGPDSCHASVIDTKGLSAEDAMKKLKESLKTKQPVRCDEINWAIFGVSATIWNTLYLLMMLFISGLCFVKKITKRNRSNFTR